MIVKICEIALFTRARPHSYMEWANGLHVSVAFIHSFFLTRLTFAPTLGRNLTLATTLDAPNHFDSRVNWRPINGCTRERGHLPAPHQGEKIGFSSIQSRMSEEKQWNSIQSSIELIFHWQITRKFRVLNNYKFRIYFRDFCKFRVYFRNFCKFWV